MSSADAVSQVEVSRPEDRAAEAPPAAPASPSATLRRLHWPRLLVILLLVACLWADLRFGVYWPSIWQMSNRADEPWPVLTEQMRVLLLSQFFLSIAWFLLARSWIVWRVLLVLVVVGFWETLLQTWMPSGRIHGISVLLIYLAPTLVWALCGASVLSPAQRLALSSVSGSRPRGQYSLLTLVCLLTLAGPLMVALPPTGWRWPTDWRDRLFLLGLSTTIPVIVGVTLGSGAWRQALLGVLFVALWPMALVYAPSLIRPLPLEESRIFGGVAVALAAMLLVLRAAGYRLVWRPVWRRRN